MNKRSKRIGKHFFFAIVSGILLLLTGMFPLFLHAQEDTIRSEDDLNMIIEDVIGNNQIEEDIDFSQLTDMLEDLRRRPLNLNDARPEQLRNLPGLNDLLINNLINYRNTLGKLSSIYELQAVPGFSEEVIRQILPFITVKEIGAKDISPGTLHPSGPGVKELSKTLSGEVTQRFIHIVQLQKGFTPPDTLSDGSLSSRYQGSRFRSYTRFRVRSGQNLSFSLVAEKDAGELMRWDPQNNYYGFDFYGAHLAIRNYGALKTLVIGDYNIQAGQGIILSRQIGFGKGGEVINAVKQPNNGILPNASVNEYAFLRGAAATIAIKQLYFTAFFSRFKLDANVLDRDTLTEEADIVSSIQISGLHRTPSEIENRKAIPETILGGRVEYKSSSLTIGTSHYYQRFGGGIARPLNDYNMFDFTGEVNYLNGLDFDWVFRNFNFFGEVARSKSGGIGATAGLMGSLSHTVDVSFLVRSFDKDFHSLRSFVFAERPAAAQNERGVYIGVRVKPTEKWTIHSYFDFFQFPFNKFRTSFPSSGFEYLAQLDYRPRRGTIVYARFRTEHKEENAPTDLYPAGPQLKYLVPIRRDQFRLHFETKISDDISIKTRGEASWFQRGDSESSRGFLVYQDLSWKIGYKLKLTGRYALFDVSDFDARIYAYENDILGFFSIPPFSRTGSRYYVILNAKPVRGVEIWLRFAQTRFFDPNTTNDPVAGNLFWGQGTVGSGLDEIIGSSRSEIKFQVRYRF